jgi:hypothetical protein
VKHYYDDDDLWEEGEKYYVLHCPFCGSSETDLHGYLVACERCEASGPRLDNWKQALKAWNDMPRLKGAALKKQRSCWTSRYRREREAEKRHAAARKKERDNSPEEKQRRADEKWAREREAWLRSPIEGSA